jgi:multimeric flavodoxin WrbA
MEKSTKMVIVNASPKGAYSLTLQYAKYLMVHEHDVTYTVLEVGEKLTEMEYDETWFAESMLLLAQCEAIIWATPVYTMLVPWQLIRFIELIKLTANTSVVEGKYATSVMSCFHYFDHLAEQWLYSTCEDLGMRLMEGFSVDNTDLLKPEFRSSMRFFMQEFHRACVNRSPVIRRSRELQNAPSPQFMPTLQPENTKKHTDIRTVLLTDEIDQNGNLSEMIKVFRAAYPNEVEVVNINDFPYEGACKGCLRCELVGECDHHDGFQDFYQNLVNSCDVLIHAMNLDGRYLKSIWKLFLDRTFSNGHRTSMMGKHSCYLVCGHLGQLPHVRQFLEGKDRVGKENSMGIISDEIADSSQLQSIIEDVAIRLDRAARAGYQKGTNFLGVGGMKIFRDLIYGMRGVVRDDHRFYKARGLYDFPQRNVKNELFNLAMGRAFMFKSVRLGAFNHMKELYIREHKKLVDRKIL